MFVYRWRWLSFPAHTQWAAEAGDVLAAEQDCVTSVSNCAGDSERHYCNRLLAIRHCPMINGARLRSTETEWSYLHVSSVQMKSGVDWWDISIFVKKIPHLKLMRKRNLQQMNSCATETVAMFIFWQCLYSCPSVSDIILESRSESCSVYIHST